MKKTIVRLLVAILLIGTLVGMLVACGDSEFTVTVMDGETSVKTYTFDKDEVITIPTADLAKTGYEVVGIYTDAAMTTALDGDLTATADLTLYVKYRAKTLDIYVDNGLGDETRVSVTYGQPYTLAAPTQDGYRFRHFTYMGEEFPLTGTYNYTNSISITAKWDRIVMLKLYNGSTLVATVPVAEDGSFTLPAVSDTADKYFGGYLNGTEPFGTKQADGTYTGTYTGKTDVDLFYKWDNIPTYTMTVNGLDGQSASYKTGDTYALPAAPERSGYRFLGYKMNGEAFAATGTFTWSEDITVTAEWSRIVYINVYDGATLVKKVEVAADGSFALDDVADVAGEKTFEGYVMGTTDFATYDATSGKWIGTYTGTEDATVMYKWEGIVHAYITFNGIDLQPILIEEGTTSYRLYTTAPTKPGFRFAGFTKGTETVTGDTYTLTGDEATTGVVLTANWSEIYYITIYDGSTAKPNKIEVAADGTVTLPKQDNTPSHLFVGYKMDGVTFEKQTDGSYSASGITASGNAFIEWLALPRVNFNTNEGVFTEDIDNFMYLTPGAVNSLPIPQRDNFTFAGWMLSGAPFGKLEDGACTFTYETWSYPSEVTLVAKWVSKDVEGEVSGKEYFRELDKSTGEILYVFLTGNTYNFETYTLNLTDNNGVVTLNTNQNGFSANKVGTFTMTMTAADGSTRTVHCKVETKITGVDVGDDTQKRNPNNFVSAEIEGVLDVGLNNFIPDVKITGIKDGETGGSTLALSAIPLKVELQYFDTDTQTWKASTAYTLVGDAFSFDASLRDKRVNLTITPVYSLKEGTNKVQPTLTFEMLLNDGVNVYTNNELYVAFKDTSKSSQTINVLRNITMALQRENVSSDATETVTDANGNVYAQYIHPTNDGDHGVYVRTLSTDGSDLCVINGNYYHVDGSNLPKFNLENPGASYSGITGDNMINMQASLFLYNSLYPERLAKDAEQKLTINDLYVTGNNLEGGEATKEMTWNGTKYNVLVGSMSFHGLRTNGAALELNNATVTNAYSDIFAVGATAYEPNRLYTSVTLNGAKIDNYMNNAVFNWGQVGVTVNNSEIGQGSGPAFQFEDYPLKDDAYGSFLYIDKDTTVNNWLSGTEAWFVGYKLTPVATQLKANLGPAVPLVAQFQQYLKNVGINIPEIAPTSMLDSTGMFNFICSVKAANEYTPTAWTGTELASGDAYKTPGIRLVNESETVHPGSCASLATVDSQHFSTFFSFLPAEVKAMFSNNAAAFEASLKTGFPPYTCYDKRGTDAKFAFLADLGSFGNGMLVAGLMP